MPAMVSANIAAWEAMATTERGDRDQVFLADDPPSPGAEGFQEKGSWEDNLGSKKSRNGDYRQSL
jgi:hypothetical protein